MRRVLAAFAVILAALAVAGCASPAQEVASTQPNIILIQADDLDLKMAERLPNIKSFIADEGASFDNFYVSMPSCCPSRASTLTGEYVHTHGVLENLRPRGGFTVFRDLGHEERTLAALLSGAGYHTALQGKYLNEYGSDSNTTQYVPPYWDSWLGRWSAKKYSYDVTLTDGTVKHFGRSASDYSDAVIGEYAQRTMTDNTTAGYAFFDYVAFTGPHSPYTKPPANNSSPLGSDEHHLAPSFNEADVSDKPLHVQQWQRLTADEKRKIKRAYDQRLRAAMDMDKRVGDIVAHLEDLGELDNTYLFFFSDNGWHNGEHRVPAAKGTPYEEASHMPLYVRGPGIEPGTHVADLVSNIDFYATFADIANGERERERERESPDYRDGTSLLPLLKANATDSRESILIEDLAIHEGRESGLGEGKPIFRAMVDKSTGTRYKYAEHDTGEVELYDLDSDPFELESLHTSTPPETLAALSEKLAALANCQGVTCREADGGLLSPE